MISGVLEFFAELIDPATRGDGDAASKRAVQVATAVLMLEMLRMDDNISQDERVSMASALRGQFGLSDEQYAHLVASAEQKARQATDYYQFTSLINRHCNAGEKLRIVENLWRMAMADRRLHAGELHLMRKLADLLYVSHGDYIAAKQRAREALDLSPD